MSKGSFGAKFVAAQVHNYKENLQHILPIPDLDCLVDLHTDNVNDTRVLQLPFVVALGIMMPMDEPLGVLSSQSHAGRHIGDLFQWMSDARNEMEISTSSLCLVRALLLAALCHQYNGNIQTASDCFEKAKAKFDDILSVVGGLEGLEERLPDDDFCDLAVTSWGFSNFAFLDLTDNSPPIVPLVHLNLGIVQEICGRQAEEILLKRQLWINFKNQASDLQCSSVASKPLLAMLRSFQALKVPTNLISGEVSYPIAYFECVHCCAYIYRQAVSIYQSLPYEAQQELCSELSHCAENYRDLIGRAREQWETLGNLERSRLKSL